MSIEPTQDFEDSVQSDSDTDSESSIILQIDDVILDLKMFQKRTKESLPELLDEDFHHINNIKTSVNAKGKTLVSLQPSGITDMPTLRNVQTVIAVFVDHKLVNENGSIFPISADNLYKYIEIQVARMRSGQLSYSSLNWYLQSLRRYCLDTGQNWDSIRQTPLIKNAIAEARKLGNIQNKKKKEEKGLSTLASTS